MGLKEQGSKSEEFVEFTSNESHYDNEEKTPTDQLAASGGGYNSRCYDLTSKFYFMNMELSEKTLINRNNNHE